MSYISSLFFPLFCLLLCSSELYARLPSISGGVPLSSPPKDHIITATSAPPPATDVVNVPHIETNTSPQFACFGPIGDFDTLSEVGSVDMDRLNLGLSLLVQPHLLARVLRLPLFWVNPLSPFFP